jgi:hypothetical protein
MNNKICRLARFLLRSIAFILFLSLTIFTTCNLDDDDGDNYQSSNPAINPSGIPTPNAPIVTASDGMLTLSWNDVKGAEKYYVYVSTNQQPPSYPYKEVVGTTTVLTGLTNRIYYYVWIKAVNSSGSSNFSPHARGLP